MQVRDALLLSIKPKYAKAIYDGLKKYEFRRACPRVHLPLPCFFYESKPVSLVTGRATVLEILHGSDVELVSIVQNQDPFRESYLSYLKGARHPGALCLALPQRFENGIPLTNAFPSISRPPQSFCYLTHRAFDGSEVV